MSDLTPAEQAAAEAPEAAVKAVVEMLEQFLSGHLDDLEREGEDWSGAHPISIESDARNIIAAAQGPIAAKALRVFADGTRFPSHWILFRRADGSGVTVSDLLRETAARYEGTTR